MSEQTNDLNAAQIAMVQEAVKQVIEGIKVRQWCVEMAVKAATGGDVATVARGIYDFVTGEWET